MLKLSASRSRQISLLLVALGACTPLPSRIVKHNRWDVKTLTDPGAHDLLPNESMTIGRLVNFKDHEVGKATERLNIERKVVTVKANIVDYREEKDDGDIHLIIKDDAGNSIIAEVPDPNDPIASRSDHAKQFEAVRNWLSQKLGEPTHWNGERVVKIDTLQHC